MKFRLDKKYFIFYLLLLIYLFLNFKFIKYGIVNISEDQSNDRIKIETFDNSYIVFNYEKKSYRLYENSILEIDKKQFNLKKGYLINITQKNRNFFINKKIFFDNCWGDFQFYRLEINNIFKDISSDITINYYTDKEELKINPKLIKIYSNKEYGFNDYYGFFIPYSPLLKINRINLKIKIYEQNNILLMINENYEIKEKLWAKQIITFDETKSKQLTTVDRNTYYKQLEKRRKIMNEVSESVYFNKNFIYPVEQYNYITSQYGLIREWRLSNNKLYMKDTHPGIDYADKLGSNIYAVCSGVVKYAEYGEYVGNMIIIDHGGGVFSNYMHLDKILVNVDSYVNKGDIIGTMGKTGAATGPHLHWEIRVYGIPVNPLIFLYIEDIFK